MNPLQQADALSRAADRIDEVGHWRGWTHHENKNGRECVVTALLHVTGNSGAVIECLEPLCTELGFERRTYGWAGIDVGKVTNWNDDQTDGSVVTSLLRKVAGDIRKAEAHGLVLV